MRQPTLRALRANERFELIRGAFAAEVGAGLVVPLFQPGEQFEEAGEHGHEAFLRPAFALFAVLVKPREGDRALQVIPAGPAVDGLAIIFALAAGVRDEAFLGDVELATEG